MTRRPPRVSVLLPCYNGAAYLEEAVRSILLQTFADFELIVVDDGSTDATADILARMGRRDPRLRVVRQPNGGIVAALNTAIAHARGEYIARMDADDVSFPERFAFQVAWLDAHPATVLVGGYAVGDPRPTPASVRTTGGATRAPIWWFSPRVAVSMHPSS
ncbi:glycosyltransferase family 2 protein [Novosphingobium panipatense]